MSNDTDTERMETSQSLTEEERRKGAQALGELLLRTQERKSRADGVWEKRPRGQIRAEAERLSNFAMLAPPIPRMKTKLIPKNSGVVALRSFHNVPFETIGAIRNHAAAEGIDPT